MQKANLGAKLCALKPLGGRNLHLTTPAPTPHPFPVHARCPSYAKLDNSIVNRYLSAADDDFVHCVELDIRRFIDRANPKAVLIFPPFSSYRRFLIHRVCASRSFNQHEIVTFSIGIGDERRTVVCFRHQLLQDVKANIGKRFEESAAGGEYGTATGKPSHYASWRSSTTPPTASTSTITTSNSSCGSRASGNIHATTTSTTTAIGIGINSPVTCGRQQRDFNPDAANHQDDMGTDTVLLQSGGAIGVRQQQSHLIDKDVAAFSDTMQDPSPHTESNGQPFSNGSGTGVKFPPVVGIYRPPAARRALNLAENIVHQLAPPAACEHPNDYSHLAPAVSRLQQSQLQLLLQATATGTEPDQLPIAPNSAEGHPLRKDKAGTCEKTGPTGQEQVQTTTTTNVPDGAIGGSTTGNSSDRNSDGITSPSARTNRPPRERRPDRAVYVPRARRSLTTPPTVSAISSQPQASPAEPTSPAKGLLRTATSNRVQQLTEPGSSSEPVIPTNFQPVSSKEVVQLKESKRKVSELTTAGQQITSGNTETLSCNTVIKEALSNAHPADGSEVSLESFKKRNISLEEQQQQRQELPTSVTGLVEKEDCRQEISPEHSDTKQIETSVTMHRNNQRNNRNVRNATSTPLATSMLITDSNGAEKIDRDEKELRRASKEINRSNRRIMKQTFNSDVLEIDDPLAPPAPVTTAQKSAKVKRTPVATTETEKVEVQKPMGTSTSVGAVSNGTTTNNGNTGDGEEDEDDWESMYDDNGDCLNPKMLEELTTAVGKVSIETPQSDYKLFETKQAVLNEEEFPHVLEVSNFPAEFKTQDLMMLFSQYKESGFDIKWVDDTHALAVFSSSKIAAEVLTTGLSFGRVKPLAEATAESRSKARKCSSSLQPYRARPETCAAMARRMVTSALGVKLKTAPEERENERRVLREAKERKRLAAKQRDEVWDS